MDDGGQELEVDKAYQQVCEEVGIELNEQLAKADEGKLGNNIKVIYYKV